MASNRKTSPWVYVACGCGFAIFLAVAAVIGFGWWGMQEIKDFEERMEDPEARAREAQKVLGYEELPPGYHPMIGFSIPFVMKTAILSDKPPPPPGQDHNDQGFGERGFIYFEMLSFGDQQELEDYFEGKVDDAEALRQSNIRIDPQDTIARGRVEVEGVPVRYAAQRGDVTFQGMNGEGISTMLLIECPGDSKMRMGIWFGPDPDPDAAADEVDLTGTPGDEREIERFLSYFTLCPG